MVKVTSRVEVIEGQIPQLKSDAKEALKHEVEHIKEQLGNVRSNMGILLTKLDGNGEDPILVRMRLYNDRIEHLEGEAEAGKKELVLALQQKEKDGAEKALESRKDRKMIWAATITGGSGFLAVVVKSILEYLATLG